MKKDSDQGKRESPSVSKQSKSSRPGQPQPNARLRQGPEERESSNARFRYNEPDERECPNASFDDDFEERQPSNARFRYRGPEERKSKMVTLGKGRRGGDVDNKHSQKKREKDAKWAQAKSFVPGQKYCGAGCPSSYAAAIGGNDSYEEELVHFSGIALNCDDGRGGMPLQLVTAQTPLCPFYAAGGCQNEDCPYVHGDICDMCGLPQLHPANERQQAEHRRECLADHEREMEKAFAVAASEGKECGICLENVLHKFSSTGSYADSRFGILENCNHCFCLLCIRQWRNHKEESMEMQRTCPTCRVHSNFIVPSKYWVETPEEKAKLIDNYRNAVKGKPCRYFKNGKGFCPFDSKCFYLHALPDGTKVTENLVKPRRRTNADGETFVAEDHSLWSFLEDRDDPVNRLLMRELFLAELGDFSDSDASDQMYFYYDSSSSDD